MFSLLSSTSSPSASSSSPNYGDLDKIQTLLMTNPSLVSSEQKKVYNDQIKALKSKMPYVVTNNQRSSSTTTRKKGRKNCLRDGTVISKTYNEVASRPILHKAVRINVITVNMRIDFPAAFSTSTIASTFGASSFNLGQFNGTAAYTGLFDQYRFDLFEVWFEPQSNYLSTTNVGTLTTAIDIDDANVPTTIQEVADKQNSLTTSGSAAHYHRWQPHMATAVYSGAFTSFANEPAGWIDSASNTVQHYGIKYSSTSTTAIQSFNLSLRAVVSFKNPGI